jgi:short-subunit dehydrogenase
VKESVVIITGASSGIGKELALQYGTLGANLVLAARRKANLEEVAAMAKANGAKGVLIVAADLSERDACANVIRETISRFNKIDVLYLNHALTPIENKYDDNMFIERDLLEIEDTLLKQFKINVLGMAYLISSALPYLEASAGYISIVGSASAKFPAPFHIGYVTSKTGLQGFAGTLIHELKLINSNVTLGLQTLGMIGTEENLSQESLRSVASPVDETARQMICHTTARSTPEVYIPAWYNIWGAIANLHPSISEYAMNEAYVNRVPRYVEAVKRNRRA